MKILHYIIIFSFIVASFNCTKLIEVDPPKTQINSVDVFNDDAGAIAAISAIYSRMSGSRNIVAGFTSLHTGWSSDELYVYGGGSNEQFYNNALTPANTALSDAWSRAYQFIYYSNAILENLKTAEGVTDAVKNQISGEAKFVRAFCHFMLVNLWGNVPLVLTTDYRTNAIIERLDRAEVINQVIADLIEANNLLGSSYVSAERVRPNKWAAAALLARVYLYAGDWANAVTQSSAVIAEPLYALEDNVNDIFLKTSSEAIWQIIPVVPSGYITHDGSSFVIYATGEAPSKVSLRDNVVGMFGVGDNRLTNWIASYSFNSNIYYFATKYKVSGVGTNTTENNTVLRLAEQYLIRAEAKAMMNDIEGGLGDLNVLRDRAGVADTSENSQSGLLGAIEKERVLELFTEGHRWMDLKRTGRAIDVLSSVKLDLQATDTLYPIPQSQILNDPKIFQNEGY